MESRGEKRLLASSSHFLDHAVSKQQDAAKRKTHITHQPALSLDPTHRIHSHVLPLSLFSPSSSPSSLTKSPYILSSASTICSSVPFHRGLADDEPTIGVGLPRINFSSTRCLCCGGTARSGDAVERMRARRARDSGVGVEKTCSMRRAGLVRTAWEVSLGSGAYAGPVRRGTSHSSIGRADRRPGMMRGGLAGRPGRGTRRPIAGWSHGGE